MAAAGAGVEDEQRFNFGRAAAMKNRRKSHPVIFTPHEVVTVFWFAHKNKTRKGWISNKTLRKSLVINLKQFS